MKEIILIFLLFFAQVEASQLIEQTQQRPLSYRKDHILPNYMGGILKGKYPQEDALDLNTNQIKSSYMSFSDYVAKYNKKYSTVEYYLREIIYISKISQFGSNKYKFKPGITNYTDWTNQQFRKISSTYQVKQSQQISSEMPPKKLNLPTTLDWRDQNIITSIKDQKACGACWTFVTAGIVQSFLVKQKKQSIDINLSEQFILQCSPNGSCEGGYIQYALQRVSKQCPEQKQYPYIAPSYYNGNICSSSGVSTNFARKSYYKLSDDQIISLLQNGPLGVIVSAQDTWGSYDQSSGTIACDPFSPINHGVILVGYTEDAYIIKNSWGESWGNKGYAYISRVGSENCQITAAAHYIVSNGQLKMLLSLLVFVASVFLI